MTYDIYDQNGWVGYAATSQGWKDLASAVDKSDPVVEEFFVTGRTEQVKILVWALRKDHIEHPVVQHTLEGVLPILARCEGVAIVSDGVSDDGFTHIGNENSGRYPRGSGAHPRAGSDRSPIGNIGPLKDPYGGLPGVGGYHSNTEYEISHQRYCESAHCILGSLHKAVGGDNGDDLDMALAAEEGHIYEELKIMEECHTEYGKTLYNRQLVRYNDDDETRKYAQNTITSIKENSAKLADLAADKMVEFHANQGLLKDQPEVRKVAMNAYNAVYTLARAAPGLQEQNIGSFNVWHDDKVQDATANLRASIDAMYGHFKHIGTETSGRYPKGSGKQSRPHLKAIRAIKAAKNNKEIADALHERTGKEYDFKNMNVEHARAAAEQIEVLYQKYPEAVGAADIKVGPAHPRFRAMAYAGPGYIVLVEDYFNGDCKELFRQYKMGDDEHFFPHGVKDDPVRACITHEMGHIAQDHYMGYSTEDPEVSTMPFSQINWDSQYEMVRHDSMSAQSCPSGYSQKNDREMFCECFMVNEFTGATHPDDLNIPIVAYQASRLARLPEFRAKAAEKKKAESRKAERKEVKNRKEMDKVLKEVLGGKSK